MFRERTSQRRSKAWIYYALLAIFALFVIPSAGFSMLLVSVLSGLYATYIYRGGRIVVWIW
jgi:hypothetical protein